MERLKGIGVSPGVAVGPAIVALQRTHALRFPISEAHVDEELVALERARQRSHEQLAQIRARIAAAHGPDLAAIFDAQLLILDDPLLVGRAAVLVREEHINAEWAVQQAVDELASVFDDAADPYLRERKGDVQDVAGRLRMNLSDEKGGPRDLGHHLDTACVLVADELTPSVLAQLDWSRIRGFITDAGSRTYHTAILARSLGVPAVVGLHDASRRVPAGEWVIVDGQTGDVVIAPTPAEQQEAEARARVRCQPGPDATDLLVPLTTRDGVRITLRANIDRPDDVGAARTAGAEGVGLYRSEFLLMGAAPHLAGEEEQYELYRQLAERTAPDPVTVRTFDVDEEQAARGPADSSLGGGWSPDAERPGRGGLRGIRLGLSQPDVMRTQLRALLRAAPYGALRIMFPFVASLHEVRAAKALLDQARAQLAARGLQAPDVPVGIMIEVPSAAFTAAILAREVDFFTIGTNDLIQYTLAVDRTDASVSDRYEPLHPAVLRLLRHVRRGARLGRIPVSICGEMAADPTLLRLLIGLGLTEFSMTAGAIALARRVARDTNAGDMRRMAARALTLGTAAEIEAHILEALGDLAPGDEVTSR
ncbi:MAG: phosphoenolpyruvate--protein phosphotransferase [Vicinamibacterales bacterium]